MNSECISSGGPKTGWIRSRVEGARVTRQTAFLKV